MFCFLFLYLFIVLQTLCGYGEVCAANNGHEPVLNHHLGSFRDLGDLVFNCIVLDAPEDRPVL